MKRYRSLRAATLLALLAAFESCNSSDPVALEGDEIDLFPTFVEADVSTGEFTVILMAIVRDPDSGVRRDGVEVLFRVTSGAAVLDRTQVVTNDDGKAYVRVEGDDDVEVEAVSGTASETIELNASGGSVGQNQRPTAVVTFSPSSPRVNQSVTFDVSGSTDSDGTIDNWEVTDFGDGDSSGELSFASQKTISHTYASTGDKQVTVIVRDNQGAAGDATVRFTVNP